MKWLVVIGVLAIALQGVGQSKDEIKKMLVGEWELVKIEVEKDSMNHELCYRYIEFTDIGEVTNSTERPCKSKWLSPGTYNLNDCIEGKYRYTGEGKYKVKGPKGKIVIRKYNSLMKPTRTNCAGPTAVGSFWTGFPIYSITDTSIVAVGQSGKQYFQKINN